MHTTAIATFTARFFAEEDPFGGDGGAWVIRHGRRDSRPFLLTITIAVKRNEDGTWTLGSPLVELSSSLMKKDGTPGLQKIVNYLYAGQREPFNAMIAQAVTAARQQFKTTA